MLYFYGSKFLGKTDGIQGVGYVKTEFAHVNWVPLFPLRSFFVIAEDSEGIQGPKIPFSWKSAGLGYLRVWPIILSLPLFYAAATFAPMLALIAVVLLGLGIMGNCIGKKCSPQRQAVLMGYLGLNPDGSEMYIPGYDSTQEQYLESPEAANQQSVPVPAMLQSQANKNKLQKNYDPADYAPSAKDSNAPAAPLPPMMQKNNPAAGNYTPTNPVVPTPPAAPESKPKSKDEKTFGEEFIQ